MAEKIFVDGAYVETPNEQLKEKAPYIKANIVFDVLQFSAFMQKYKNNGGSMRTTLKESKGGKLYLELNTYNPADREEKPEEPTTIEIDEALPSDEINPKDLEF